ncbi:MAG TPA: hypothetical protein VGD69_19150 [Herpetosiphonaceae bacterium]
MRMYARAYKLKDFRRFDGWIEQKLEAGEELTDDSIMFVWDDFSVTSEHFGSQQGRLAHEVTPQWQEFCKHTLHFEIPEDVRRMMEEQQTSV